MSRSKFFVNPALKPVTFEQDKHLSLLIPDTIISFKYGINLPNAYNITGRIVSVKRDDKDRIIVDAVTKDKGIRTTIPEMISKIYILKEKIVDKINRINCFLSNDSMIPRLDASLDKLIIKVKQISNIIVEDNKIDNQNEFSRLVLFKKDINVITLTIINKNSNEILVTNSMNKKNKVKHIKVTKYGIDIYSVLQSIKLM